MVRLFFMQYTRVPPATPFQMMHMYLIAHHLQRWPHTSLVVSLAHYFG
jgi:hypothetical protein